MRIDIRLLDASHLEDYKSIRLEALQNAPDAFGSSYEEEAPQRDDYHWMRLQVGPVYGAYVDGKIVGMAGVILYREMKMVHRAAIWGVYVSPDQRGKKAGQKLIGAALDNLPDYIECVTLGVGAHNAPAITLYKEMGFEEYGLEKNALKIDGRYYDESLMVKFV